MTVEKVKKLVVVENLFHLMAFSLGKLLHAFSSPTSVFKTESVKLP